MPSDRTLILTPGVAEWFRQVGFFYCECRVGVRRAPLHICLLQIGLDHVDSVFWDLYISGVLRFDEGIEQRLAD